MDKTDLIEKYDAYYLQNKNKWAMSERDKLAFETLAGYKPKPAEILDIGCGNGHTLEYFALRHSPAKLYGIDISPVAIEIAQSKGMGAVLEAVFLLDYKTNKKFEVIVCLGTAEHFEDLVPHLSKVKSLLKKGGLCYMEVPHNLIYSKGEHTYRQLQTGSRQWEWHLEQEEWEAKFIEAGFSVKKFYRRNKPQWEFCWLLEQ